MHNDEETPHLHLIFLPVVHKKDKNGKAIDKLACSEFWKEKDSYRRLQNAFYDYMVSHNFKLERGLPKEETNRQHLDLAEYKKITNFENTKEILKNIKLELPEVPDIKYFKRLSFNRDEKILEEIIKPKDEIIDKLYQANITLQEKLSRQANIIDEAEKYQKERNYILADNRELHNQVNNIKAEYKEKKFDIEWKYKNKIKGLEKENIHLHKIIDRFYETVDKFIIWICHKFSLGESKQLIKKFEEETHTFIDPVNQLKYEKAKEEEMEL